MAVKVIVELQAKPGGRSELAALLDGIVAREGSTQHGFLGSTRYEVPDNPDMLVEIAEWESAEARVVHMEEAAATGGRSSKDSFEDAGDLRPASRTRVHDL